MIFSQPRTQYGRGIVYSKFSTCMLYVHILNLVLNYILKLLVVGPVLSGFLKRTRHLLRRFLPDLFTISKKELTLAYTKKYKIGKTKRFFNFNFFDYEKRLLSACSNPAEMTLAVDLWGLYTQQPVLNLVSPLHSILKNIST